MKSTITSVSKSVLARSCITKSARSMISGAAPVHSLAQINSVSTHPRPLYTMIRESRPLVMPTFPFVPTNELIGSRMRTPRVYPREIVFLGGAPGSGKGTNSSFISNMRSFTAPTIVVSDLLNTPTCKLLKDNGVMVDDEFVFSVLLKELEKPIYRNGVVVDGFPRTAKQAEYLTNFYHEQSHSSMSPPRMLFVMLHVDEAASIQRQQLRGRKIVELNSVREQMQLPPLEIRATDVSIDASKARYSVFEEQLSAVLTLGVSFPLVMVDASSSLEAVRSNIAEQMTSLPGPLYMLD